MNLHLGSQKNLNAADVLAGESAEHVAGQIGRVFEDMLGSRQKLPAMTLLLLDHPLEAALIIWLIALATAWAIFTLQGAKHVWIVMFVSVVFIVATAHVTTALLMEPLMLVVRNLSGGV